MINFQDEIKHFKPSLDVDNIEDAIAGMDLTDMNDLMMQLVQNAVTKSTAMGNYQTNPAEDLDTYNQADER